MPSSPCMSTCTHPSSHKEVSFFLFKEKDKFIEAYVAGLHSSVEKLYFQSEKAASNLRHDCRQKVKEGRRD